MKYTVALLITTLLMLAVCAPAQTYSYSTLATFTQVNAAQPAALAIDGSTLYGYAGGGTHGDGLIFSVSTKGIFTTLYNFGATSTDGKNPTGTPNRQTTTGDLYGITTAGGKPGHGTIFKLTTKNKESTVYAWEPYWIANFTTEPLMTMDSAGNLYGYDITSSEGSGGIDGNAFQVTSKGVITQLCACEEQPAGSPIINGSTLYGVGTAAGDYGSGGVFSFTASGDFNLLYSFTGGTDGLYPQARLVQDAKGSLYGTTQYGGVYDSGVVFKVTESGTESVLYSFCALPDCADGGYPIGPIVLDSEGNAYGLNSAGVFEVTAQGMESLLYPSAVYLGYALVMDSSGNLYGTTGSAVWKLTKN